MMEIGKLKPCPFCGSEAEISLDGHCDVSYSVTRVTIECYECECEMWHMDNKGEYDKEASEALVEKAVNQWNRRVSGKSYLDWSSARIAELKKEGDDHKASIIKQNGMTHAEAFAAGQESVKAELEELQEKNRQLESINLELQSMEFWTRKE